MITTILILTLIGTGLITSIIFPVHLPAAVISTVDIFAQYIWQWEGILPISTWMNDIAFITFITMLYGVVRIVIGILALASGGGKPEV
jgi:hypothetical protein